MSKSFSREARQFIRGILRNRWAIGCFCIMAIQQMIEASSTYWLVKLTSSIAYNHNYLPYLIIYLGSLLFAYIPNCIGLIFKTSWKQDAQRTFIESFVSANRNNIGEWGNKGLKEEKLSILTSEGPNALQAFIDYMWELYTYALSVFFNILALSIVVEPLFAISYGISLTCVFVVMKMRRQRQRHLTQKALIARVELAQSLLAAWDNVLLGNEYNFQLWNESTTERLQKCLRRNIDLERFDQILAIIVSLITSIPSLLVVFYCMFKYQGDTVLLTSFVVTLPILLLILSYTYQTLSLGFRWAMHRGKLISIYKAIQPVATSPKNMEKKIKWPKIMASIASENNISLALTQPNSHKDLLEHVHKNGRLTLRGENGSGKSTALMLLKNSLAEKAFFLPTHSQLSFTAETNKYSTGESLRKRLVEILEKVEADVLLLDEWDANLDPENRESLSALIDEMSSKKCVIEVRHR